MAVAVIGITAVQVYWIKTAVALKEEQIDRTANLAMQQVVSKLQTRNTIAVLADKLPEALHPYEQAEQRPAERRERKKRLPVLPKPDSLLRELVQLKKQLRGKGVAPSGNFSQVPDSLFGRLLSLNKLNGSFSPLSVFPDSEEAVRLETEVQQLCGESSYTYFWNGRDSAGRITWKGNVNGLKTNTKINGIQTAQIQYTSASQNQHSEAQLRRQGEQFLFSQALPFPPVRPDFTYGEACKPLARPSRSQRNRPENSESRVIHLINNDTCGRRYHYYNTATRDLLCGNEVYRPGSPAAPYRVMVTKSMPGTTYQGGSEETAQTVVYTPPMEPERRSRFGRGGKAGFYPGKPQAKAKQMAAKVRQAVLAELDSYGLLIQTEREDSAAAEQLRQSEALIADLQDQTRNAQAHDRLTEAKLRHAEAQIRAGEAKVRAAEAGVKQAEAQIRAAELAKKYAEAQQTAKLAANKKKYRNQIKVESVSLRPHALPAPITPEAPPVPELNGGLSATLSITASDSAAALPADNTDRNIGRVMDKVVYELQWRGVPARQRLQLDKLDSLLTQEFKTQNLPVPFEYAVLHNNKPDGPRSKGFKTEEINQALTANLFPENVFGSSDLLAVTFSDKRAYALHSLGLMLASSLFFTFVILSAFGASVATMLRQKKVSEIKTDFINNMTHEFKTPIATISLAADAIENPLVTVHPEKVKYFTGLIRDENKRMNNNVERVLQMAQLDRQSMSLNREQVSVTDLVAGIACPMRLQAEQAGGTLDLVLPESTVTVFADAHHTGNVLANLLDNALKYTEGPPEISVTVFVSENRVHISVSDKGIGLSAAARRQVFDKFYRVEKGNVHNVKGFGLGLSYAKAVADAHQGEITVKSRLGKGSEFTLSLPLDAQAT